jgi:hypothetical protein
MRRSRRLEKCKTSRIFRRCVDFALRVHFAGLDFVDVDGGVQRECCSELP